MTVPERTGGPAPPAPAPALGSVLLDVVVRTLDTLSTRAVAQHPVVAAYAAWLAAPPAPAEGASEGGNGSRYSGAALRDALRRTGATRRYHDVAVLGYAAGTAGADVRTAPAFRDGLVWLRGRRYFSANQALGLEADGLALLGIAAGIAAVSDSSGRDADARWLADLADESVRRATAADPWEDGLRRAARRVACGPGLAHSVPPPAGLGEDGDVQPDLAAAMAAKRLVTLDPAQELAAMRTVLTPNIVDVVPARAVTQRAALRWLLRQGATALPRRASVTDVVAMLAAVPHALKRWPWEDRPRTSRAGAAPQRWDVQNEYHVQSLLWSMLAPVFPDLEDEEYLRSIGHKHPRADLAIPSLGLIIEVKYLRDGTQSALSGVTEQVSADTGLYLSVPSEYTQIVAFVWDDSRSNHQHTELLTGLRRLRGVTEAVIVARPGGWTTVPAEVSERAE